MSTTARTTRNSHEPRRLRATRGARAAVAAGAVLLALGSPSAPLAGQSDGEEGAARRAHGQVHRTIRRAGPGSLPRPVHGVRVGATTAAVAGEGARPGSPGAPGPGTFAPLRPLRPGPQGRFPRRPIGILRGLPPHLVHGPLRGAGYRAGHGPEAGAPGAVARPPTAGAPWRPPAGAPPALPPAAGGPRGACAVASVRLATGPERRLRIATGPLGAETVGEAAAILASRIERRLPVALHGWDGSGLITPAGGLRAVALAPCGPEDGDG